MEYGGVVLGLPGAGTRFVHALLSAHLPPDQRAGFVHEGVGKIGGVWWAAPKPWFPVERIVRNPYTHLPTLVRTLRRAPDVSDRLRDHYALPFVGERWVLAMAIMNAFYADEFSWVPVRRLEDIPTDIIPVPPDPWRDKEPRLPLNLHMLQRWEPDLVQGLHAIAEEHGYARP